MVLRMRVVISMNIETSSDIAEAHKKNIQAHQTKDKCKFWPNFPIWDVQLFSQPHKIKSQSGNLDCACSTSRRKPSTTWILALPSVGHSLNISHSSDGTKIDQTLT
jgi:hypothetical protein